MFLGGSEKEGKHATRVREQSTGTNCTGKEPHMTRNEEPVAMASKRCGGKGPRERGIRTER